MRITSNVKKLIILGLLSLGGLTACGGGADTEGNSPSAFKQTEDEFLAGAGAEALGYYNEVWKNLSDKSRCGNCHNAKVGQAPQFVDASDNKEGATIADNYEAIRPYVNFVSTGDSLIVTKIRDGHKASACWLPSELECSIAIKGYLDSWNNQTSTTDAVPGYTLVAPSPLRDVVNTKSFPVSSANFANAPAPPNDLYSLLVNRCSSCHGSPTSQGAAGSFASSDRDQAYQEAQQKIDLLDPANSRLVYRLREQSHNCWDDPATTDPSVDCEYSSQVMEDAITAFANTITEPTPIDPNLIISKAMKLQPPEAIIAAGGERHLTNQIALWEFKKGTGNQAFDTSNVEPLMHLSLSGDYNWVGGYGIQFRNGQAQASYQTSKKLLEEAELRQEYSIEAWVIPSLETQRKNMISYSGGETTRNFTLSQYDNMYQFNNRSVETDANGEDFNRTADADVQISQQHIVVTYDKDNGSRIYVNGVYTDDVDPNSGGAPGFIKDPNNNDQSVWNDKLSFILGNEVGVFDGSKAWQGIFRMVAVHNRALSAAQIEQNFKAGVGEKFFLLFNIEDVDGGVSADSYIKMQAEQFDTYSYLFSNPVYVNLGNPVPAPISIPIAGMRIGINGKEATVGQSFTNIKAADGSPLVITQNYQEISTLGTMVEVQQGTQVDDFFLTFETLGTKNNTFALATPAAPAVPASLDPQSKLGVRTFSEVNATMSELTGVPTSNSSVLTAYGKVIQQLPAAEDINAFVPANIIGISQLAFEYCDQLVQNSVLRGNFFNVTPYNFNGFGLTVANAFDTTAKKEAVVNALYDRMIGIPVVEEGAELINAPTRIQVTDELINLAQSGSYPGNLLTRLDNAGSSTNDIIKAMCTSVLGSAAMSIQ